MGRRRAPRAAGVRAVPRHPVDRLQVAPRRSARPALHAVRHHVRPVDAELLGARTQPAARERAAAARRVHPLQPDVAGDHLRLRARDQPDAPPLPGAVPAAAPRARPARPRPALDVPRAVPRRLARRPGDRAAVRAVDAATGASGRGAGRRGRGRCWRDARVVDAPARPLVARQRARRRALARRGARAGVHGAGAGRDRDRRPAVARDRRRCSAACSSREPWRSSRSASASPTRWPAASRCGDRGGSVRRTCDARFAGRS